MRGHVGVNKVRGRYVCETGGSVQWPMGPVYWLLWVRLLNCGSVCWLVGPLVAAGSVRMFSVPARLGKGQGAKEIGHNLARERPKFGHNLARERHKIGHTFTRERPKFGHNPARE